MKLHPAINMAYIAKRIGVSKQFLSQVKSGIRPMPDDKQQKLNEVLREIVVAIESNEENE